VITNVRIELTDVQRRVIATVLDQRELLTRKQVNELVQMLFEQLQSGTDAPDDGPPAAPNDPPTPAPTRAKPARPNDEGYMRGWNAVGLAIAKMKR
jgi:hypothetical protein